MPGIDIKREGSIISLPHTFTSCFGEVEKIIFKYYNTTATGSLTLSTSGQISDEKIYEDKSFAATVVAYPVVGRVSNTETAAAAGDNKWGKYAVYGDLVVSGTLLTCGAASPVGCEIWLRK